jgi:cobaltochelatase CobN
MADGALIVACIGCCCGHAERGGPKTAPGTLKREMRRAFRHAGLDGRARLAFSDCLGPCSEANVVFVYRYGAPLWLRRVNTIEPFAMLLDWLHQALPQPNRAAGGVAPLPPALAARTFAWTGGGEGPTPPIGD